MYCTNRCLHNGELALADVLDLDIVDPEALAHVAVEPIRALRFPMRAACMPVPPSVEIMQAHSAKQPNHPNQIMKPYEDIQQTSHTPTNDATR